MLLRLLLLIAGTWERGTAPGCVGVCPLYPCLCVAPGWYILAMGAGPGPPRYCLPWVARGACPGAAVPRLPVSSSLSIPRGFPLLPQKCLIGHRICPVLFLFDFIFFSV